MPETINDWFERYRPHKISEIIGHGKKIGNITDWLNYYESEKKKFWEEKYNKKIKKTKKKEKIIVSENIGEEKNNELENNGNIDDGNIDDENTENYEIYENTDSAQKKSGKAIKRHSCMIVTGNHGIGKTCIINTIVNELGYNVEKVNMCNLASSKNIMEKINKLVKGTNIFDSFHVEEKNRKKVIIVDELETSSTQTEKKFIENLFKVNEENWYLPIIYISSLKHSKLINILKSNSLNVELTQPSLDDLIIFASVIVKKERIRISPINREKTVKSIINFAQLDYRRLIYILYDLHKTYSKEITENDIIEYMEYTKRKDTDIEIKKCTAELMLNYQNMSECSRIYNGEKVLIPLMIHQNYPKFMIKSDNPNNIKLASEIAEAISTGDIIENYIYSEQNWDMQQVHCHYTCINPSYKLSALNVNSASEYLKYELSFPNDLNRTSIKNINKRNVVNANMYLRNMDINDFMCANTLSKKMIDDKKIEECANIYSNYGAKAETIISVLKINKINVEKNSVPNNIKKMFNKYL